MRKNMISVIAMALCLSTLVVAAHAGSPPAQAANPTTDAAHDSKMMATDPNNVLAMAYHQSLVAFAAALHGQTVGAGPVNVEFARDAVHEMRRNFDQMKSCNEKYMATISDEVRTNTAPMMQELETHRADLNAQLTELETAVKVDVPDATKVSTLAAGVYSRLETMSKAHQKQMSAKS